jgi:hypothetical protein
MTYVRSITRQPPSEFFHINVQIKYDASLFVSQAHSLSYIAFKAVNRPPLRFSIVEFDPDVDSITLPDTCDCDLDSQVVGDVCLMLEAAMSSVET